MMFLMVVLSLGLWGMVGVAVVLCQDSGLVAWLGAELLSVRMRPCSMNLDDRL